MKTRTLLIVDDDDDFRALIKPALEGVGFIVAEAASAGDARRWMAHHAPSLIVVDGLLPDQTGVKFIEELRAEGDGVPIVFASAFWKDLRSFKHLTEDLGVALVTHKPLIPAVLAEQVRKVLGQEPATPVVEEMELELGPLDDLRAEYMASLPAKVDELVATAEEALRSGAGTALAAARSLAHRLRGTAGSYGAAEVGDVSGRIEDALVAMQAATGPAVENALVTDLASLTILVKPRDPSGAPVTFRAPEDPRPRVLVVDPDAVGRRRLMEVGRRNLLDVVTAGDAAEALALARRAAPDCVFLDTRLGGAICASLANDLRALPGCNTLPLAFASDDDSVDSRVAAVHSGASLYLRKPLEAVAFRTAVSHLLKSVERRKPRVLIVDDDVDFARQAAAILDSAGIATTHLPDPLRILEVLDEVEPDMVFLDSVMPGMSGLDVCHMLRMTPRWQDLPILFVTVEIGMDVRLAAFRAGADDYIPKPVVGAELLARVRVRLERARLVKERFSTDALTGLLLRRTFHDVAMARLAEGRRRRRPLSVALIDLDGFKSINDHHGHAVGDEVLAAIGRLLAGRLRLEDVRARWGGEEFAILFAEEQLAQAGLVLDRLRGELARLTFRGRGGASFQVTFSAGVASYPDDGDSLEALLAVADTRLYAAKRGGRDRISVAG